MTFRETYNSITVPYFASFRGTGQFCIDQSKLKIPKSA